MNIPKICHHCGRHFVARTTGTKYSGDACSKRASKRRIRDKKIKKVSPAIDLLKYNLRVLNEKEYLSIEETCKLFGASRMTIYRQMKSGYLEVIRLGGRRIIPKKEILKLMGDERNA